MDLSTFHVIAVVSNPVRYKSRYSNYDTFEKDILRKGAQLWTVEMQTGARPAQITKADHDKHIQLWSSALPGELWHKENLINLAIQYMTRQCPNWRYVAWIDADCKFEDGFLERTVHALQTWDIVQMWSSLANLDPFGGSDGPISHSFMFCYWKGIQVNNKSKYLFGGAPGLAWAARRDCINKLGCAISGPILDFAILGSGDRNLACSLIGRVEDSLTPKFHPNYLKWMHQYQENALDAVKKNVGYVDNFVRHLWHGKKADRGYTSRWDILSTNEFNPETDLTRDASGLWRLVVRTPRQMKLRDDIRKYFRSRNEDSIDLH